MKILFWTPLFWPDIGGIEVLAMNTLPALRDRGHQCIVVASHRHRQQPDRMNWKGTPVYRFPFWAALAKRDLGLMMKIRKDLIELKLALQADLLHIHFSGYTAYFQLATAHAHPVPVLVTLHSSLADCKAGPDTLLGKFLRTADWITAVSHATLLDVRGILPEITKRSSVIYGCVAQPNIDPLPLSFEKPRIVCVGRLVREKGFDLAVDALGLLIKDYPQLCLTIVGNGPERIPLERRVAELGLTDVVEFTGNVHNNLVPQLFNMATVIVVPSRYREPFGLVALEAAQMARPIVASRFGGLLESVIHQQTGLLVENENAVAFAQAIAFFLDHPDVARQMGQAARKRVLKVFGLQRYVDEYDRLYKDVRSRVKNRQTLSEPGNNGTD